MESKSAKTAVALTYVFITIFVAILVLYFSFKDSSPIPPISVQPVSQGILPQILDGSIQYTVPANPPFTILLPQNYIRSVKMPPLDNTLSEALFAATTSDTLFMIRTLKETEESNLTQREMVDTLYTIFLEKYNKNPVTGDTTYNAPIKKKLGGNDFVYSKSTRTRLVNGVEEKENIDQYITFSGIHVYYFDFDDVHTYPNNESTDDAIMTTLHF